MGSPKDDRESLKTSMEQAKDEIAKAINRIDSASDTELAEIRGAARVLSPFVDFNSGC